MDNFTFSSPTKFVFGKNTETECGKLIKEFNGKRVLLHFGGSSALKSGLIDRVKKALEKEKIIYFTLGGVKPNPIAKKVYEGIELCRIENVDFILAVGGGSVIDSAKAIAMGVEYDGDFFDFYTGKSPKKALPVGVILTIAAAGSEGSGDSVITKGKYKRGAGGECLRPRFSILNPELTQTLSSYQTACGITDIMAHVFERYLTNTKDVEVTDRLCEALLLTMINEAPKVIKNPDDYEARANIMWAGMVAHNNIVGVGRSQDWNSHMLEHELSALYDCAHGAGLAVIMPAYMQYALEHDIKRFAQIATRVWNCTGSDLKHTAILGIEAFREFLRSIGMPISFSELGARVEDIPTLVENLGLNGKTKGFIFLDEKDCQKIYEIAGEN